VEKLQPAMEWLEHLGYRVSLGTTVGKSHHQYGGTKKERLQDFMTALNDPDVHAIWNARGGYGSVQIVDDIDLSVQDRSNKLLLGYSDFTHLHGLWQTNMLQSVHTFMPQELSEKPEATRQSLVNVMSSQKQVFTLKNPDRLKPMTLTAPVVGGNLSVLCSMIGSSTFPEVDGHVLFIEDLDELLYHIDRLLSMLRRAGILENLAALLIGGMTDMRDHEIPFGKTAREIIEEHTMDTNYPVIYDFPAGHIVDNRSFVLGKSMHIDIQVQEIIISQ
jgi:muramoyltetrapeptide carboxypeptidase